MGLLAWWKRRQERKRRIHEKAAWLMENNPDTGKVKDRIWLAKKDAARMIDQQMFIERYGKKEAK